MKQLRLCMSLLIGCMIMLFTSCDKEKEASPVRVDLTKKATIKGYVFAELDMTSAGVEYAPQGTKILVSVDYSDLNNSADGSWKDTTMVDGNGVFMVQVPADDNGVTAKISPMPFEYNQVQEYGSYFEQVPKVYKANAANVSITSNEMEVIQVSYTANDFDNFVKMVGLSGNLVAELNDTIVGQEETTDGIELNFHSDGWSTSVTTGANGAFTVVVPASQTIMVDYSFEENRVTWNIETGEYVAVPFLYEAEDQSLGSFPDSEDKLEIDAGSGVFIEE